MWFPKWNLKLANLRKASDIVSKLSFCGIVLCYLESVVSVAASRYPQTNKKLQNHKNQHLV
ncbi:CLUMA_CG002306, isoform A [Clunio marinus]|uniref:CLUMA_CG002306, isoform A n=1 Tax=Clunio marinus TaxID=568069 RepID=A0A1J1HKA8_9DIPT|nr:CLUMA_CG002306, isoform A [Clunio marinus]